MSSKKPDLTWTNDLAKPESSGFSLGAMLAAAGVSALAGALIGIFSSENPEKTAQQQYPHRTVPVQPPEDCAICYDSLGSATMEQLPCGHLFHQRCLMRWLSDWQRSCPVCRVAITGKQFEIYQKRSL